MLDELKRFEKDLHDNQELAEKFDRLLTEVKNSGEPKSDSELFSITAAKMGYTFSAAELERAAAEIQELDTSELEQVAGGDIQTCTVDWGCGLLYRNPYLEDEHGHDKFCWTIYHCLTAFMHTESERKDVNCWSDYYCVYFSKKN